MRQQWANILLAGGLGGCSLIYNPSNIPPTSDGMVDVKEVLDADPSMLAITRVSPDRLLEGQGDGGSRKAVVVLQGMHMVPGATVMIAKHGGGAANLTADPAQVAEDGNAIAFTVTVPVDTALPAGMEVELDITVMQPVPGAGMVTLVIGDDEPVALKIAGYDELEGAAISLGNGVHEYSRVTITGGITTTNTPAAEPLVIRSNSSASITGTTNVNATVKTGVAGGGSGGSGGTLTVGAGAGEGPAGGRSAGAGGSYASMGGGDAPPPFGDPSIPSFVTHRSSGGSGGNYAVTNGGAGGGGGGTIEVTAGGTLEIGMVSAKGAPGLNGAQDGGGGSGGTIVLRSAVSVAASGVDVAGGAGTGTGGLGRVRIDAPGTLPAQTTPAYYRGATFVDPPLITTDEQPDLTVRGQPLTGFTYYFAKADGTDMRGPYGENFPGNGEKAFNFKPGDILFEGLNNLCVQVDKADLSQDRAESRNCVQIVRLYKKP